MTPQFKKVALVHDFLLTFGGAERVLKELASMYPEAPIYTLLKNSEVVKKAFSGHPIRTSFLQRFPQWLRKRYWLLAPFFPIAVETFDLRDFDLVISSSGAWSKGIVTRLNTRHVAYLHSPMRFFWDSFHWHPALQKKRQLFRRLLMSYLRLWDKEATDRPDLLLANSHYTENRIQKYYRRKSVVVYPPVAPLGEGESREIPLERQYFLVVSRLTAAKRVDIVVDAFTKLNLPLLVVGEGREKKRLKEGAGENISFREGVGDTELANLYRGARALIQPSDEDFGIAMVEALLHETPVIAYSQGGATEIVEAGSTGEFFQAQTPEVLADGVRRFIEKEKSYSKEKMRETGLRFSSETFRKNFKQVINELGS